MKIFLLIFLFSWRAYAYELKVVQAVSNSNRTFITRGGKKDNIILGKKATFTYKNVSVIATAITVTRDQTQWRVDNEVATTPFLKGDVVTMHDATEYLWALTPEEIKKNYVKSMIHENKTSLELGLSLNRSISETTSDVKDTETQRGGYELSLGLSRSFHESFEMAFSLRFSREVINAESSSLVNQRIMGIIEPRYYFPEIRNFYRSQFFIGLSAGFGQSYTVADGLSSPGTARLLPGVKLAFLYPKSKEWKFIFDLSFDSLETEEKVQNSKQKTTFSNAKAGVTFKKVF